MEFFYHHHVGAQNASSKVLIALDAIPEVPRRPLQELFQVFFLGTKLGQALQVMSTSKAVPEGLKNQECEKGSRKKRPPIPYVPVSDEVQEAVLKGKDFSYKIKLPDKTEFSVPIWDTGTQEAFLIHVQQAKSACKRKGLFQDYDDAIEAEKKSVEQAKSLRKAIANAIGPKSKKDTEDPNQPSPDNLKASLTDTLLEKKKAIEAKATAAEGFFLLYANLLSKDARFRWDKIVSCQVRAAPWTNLQGNEHKKRAWLEYGVLSGLHLLPPSGQISPAMLRNNSASTAAIYLGSPSESEYGTFSSKTAQRLSFAPTMYL